MPIEIGKPLTPEQEAEHIRFMTIFLEVLEAHARLLDELEEEAGSQGDPDPAPADEGSRPA